METETQKNLVVSAEIVPLFASVVSSEPESIAKRTWYVEEGKALAGQLASIHARDQESYELLASVMLECKEFMRSSETKNRNFTAYHAWTLSEGSGTQAVHPGACRNESATGEQ